MTNSANTPATIDAQFKALSDGTRRALLEYLVREGEQSVHALTAISGVSQPMVSRHMAKLKRGALVGFDDGLAAEAWPPAPEWAAPTMRA